MRERLEFLQLATGVDDLHAGQLLAKPVRIRARCDEIIALLTRKWMKELDYRHQGALRFCWQLYRYALCL